MEISRNQIFRIQLHLLLLFTYKYFSSSQICLLWIFFKELFFLFVSRIFIDFSRTKISSWWLEMAKRRSSHHISFDKTSRRRNRRTNIQRKKKRESNEPSKVCTYCDVSTVCLSFSSLSIYCFHDSIFIFSFTRSTVVRSRSFAE